MKKQIKLNLGCGIVLHKGWVNVDNFFTLEDLIDGAKTKKGLWRFAEIPKGAEFVQGDIHKLPFPDNYADYALLDNVIEHVPYREVPGVLAEIRRVLKPGGTLKVITPDMDALVLQWLKVSLLPFDYERYIETLRPIVGGQEQVGEFHQCLFTLDSLNYSLALAGFTEGQLLRCKKGDLCEPDGVGLRESVKKRHVYMFDWLVGIVKK